MKYFKQFACKKQFIQKFVATVLLFAGLLTPVLLLPQEAMAANCSGVDYYDFISNVRSENTRRSYFEDFFTLSYCQINDILALYDELDTLNDNFRSAAFDCSDTSTYKQQYHEILMETHFVREVQKRDPGVTRESDAKKIEETKDLFLEALEVKMKEKFVSNEARVSEGTFEDYFDVWEYKYYDKIGEYANCSEGAWGELTESWNGFMETIRGLGDMDLEPANKSMFDKSKFSADIKGNESFLDPIKDTFGSWKAVKEDAEQSLIENAGPSPTIEDAVRVSYSIEDAFNALVAQSLDYELEEAASQRMSKYHRLYGQGGAQAATNMQGIITQISAVILTMNKDLATIKTQLHTVSEKQCSD